MDVVIDLRQRVIELGEDVQLHFPTDDSFFHLRVIALVAERIKECAQAGKASTHVPVSEIEEQAWVFNAEKPRHYDSRRTMRVNIYQTWKNRLPSKLDECIKQATRSAKNSSPLHRSRFEDLFMCAEGQGPDNAAYCIAEKPEHITITWPVADAVFPNSPCLTGMSLTEAYPEEKVRSLVEMVKECTEYRVFGELAFTTLAKVQEFLRLQETRCVDKAGHLPLTVEEYADEFVKLLGVQGVSGRTLVWSWLEELNADWWWVELTTGEPIGTTPRDVPIPKVMAQACVDQGDVISLACVLHRAYVASVLASKRKHVLSLLAKQSVDVRTQVNETLAQDLGYTGLKGMRMASDQEEAFQLFWKLSYSAERRRAFM